MIGRIVAILTTSAHVPQVLIVIKTQATVSISFLMYVIGLVWLFLWWLHGVMIKDFPLIAANSIPLVLSGIILCYKININE